MIYSRSVVDEDLTTTAYYNISIEDTSNSTEDSNSSNNSNRSNTTSAVRETKVRTIK
jgi:hypothetical protein